MEDLLYKLSVELENSASFYRRESLRADSVQMSQILKLLGERSEQFKREILESVNTSISLSFVPKNAVTQTDARATQNDKRHKIASTAARIESRECRLERLYREVLQSKFPDEKLRRVLKAQSSLVEKWHSFVIIEEANWSLGEVEIPHTLKIF